MTAVINDCLIRTKIQNCEPTYLKKCNLWLKNDLMCVPLKLLWLKFQSLLLKTISGNTELESRGLKIDSTIFSCFNEKDCQDRPTPTRICGSNQPYHYFIDRNSHDILISFLKKYLIIRIFVRILILKINIKQLLLISY